MNVYLDLLLLNAVRWWNGLRARQAPRLATLREVRVISPRSTAFVRRPAGAVARRHGAVLHGATATRGYTAMKKDTRLGDAEMLARALARWEGEGGALAPTGATDSIGESELRILARLGAALLDKWSDLSPALQDYVVRRARTLGGAGDHSRVKEQLARFLHEHRSDC